MLAYTAPSPLTSLGLRTRIEYLQVSLLKFFLSRKINFNLSPEILLIKYSCWGGGIKPRKGTFI